MGQRRGESPAPGRRGVHQAVRYAASTAAMLASAVAAVAAYHRTVQFLIGDPRFKLSAEAAVGDQSGGVHIAGVEHARRERLLAVFEPDYGRSVYLTPLEERREQLLAVEWVKAASLRRAWPNRLEVQVTERQPVAFAQIPAGRGGASRLALIDEDGVLLEPPQRSEFRLPVLTGLRREKAARREGVAKMLKLLAEVGPLAEKISEIDVSDLENLRVTEQLDHRVLTLVVGNRDFRRRLEKFHAFYPEIRDQLGDAATLDLRVENRIIAVKGGGGAR